MTAELRPADTLRAARELIANPKGWTQEAYARTETGEMTQEDDPDAVCFCTVGAVFRIAGAFTGQSDDALKFIRAATGLRVSDFNDTACHTGVLVAFDKAIALAEAAS